MCDSCAPLYTAGQHASASYVGMWARWYALGETTRAHFTRRYGSAYAAALALFGGK